MMEVPAEEAPRAHPAPKENGLRALWGTLSLDFRDACLYVLFLGLFCTTTFGARSSNAYFTTKSLDDSFFSSTFALDKTFYDIGGRGEVFAWLNSTFLPAFLPVDSHGSLSNFVDDGNAVRVGLARIRLVRVEADSCSLPSAIPNITRCYSGIGGNAEATGSFHGYLWQSTKALGNPSITSVETGVTYPGSGFAIDIPNNSTAAQALLEGLRNATLLDQSSRALFVDFNTYNPNVNMFSVVTTMIELLPAGAVMPSVIFRVSPLLRVRMVLGGEAGAHDTAWLALEMILYFAVLCLIAKDGKRMMRQGWRTYLGSSAWRILDAINYAVFLAVIILRIMSVASVESVYDDLDKQHQYTNMIGVANASISVDNLNAFNAVLCTVRFFNVARAHKGLAQFTDTLGRAGGDLFLLLVVVCVVLSGYAIGFQLGFGNSVHAYRTFLDSALTLFRALLADFDFAAIRDTNRFLGPLLFTSFIVVVFFVVLSMFLAIVTGSYDAVMHKFSMEEDTGPIQRDMMRLGDLLSQWCKTAWARRRGPQSTPTVHATAGDDLEQLHQAETGTGEDRAGAVGQQVSPAQAAVGGAGEGGNAPGGVSVTSVSSARAPAGDPWLKDLSTVSSKSIRKRMVRLQKQQVKLDRLLEQITTEMRSRLP